MPAPHRRLLAAVLALWLAASVGAVAPSARAVAASTGAFVRPLDGAVAQAFDPPRSRYGVGHRGVDLLGSGAVVAAGEGTVAFAGSVAGDRWVSVDHGLGLVTSYGPLATVAVARGDLVGAGTPLGTAGRPHGGPAGVHWSARVDGVYIDPLTLLAERRPALVGAGGWQVSDLTPVPRYEPWTGEQRFGIVPRSPEADGPGYVHPPNPNHAIAIAGLSSATGEPPFDLTHLGYPSTAVTELSYAGREQSGEQALYGPPDTWQGVEAAAARLEEQLRAQWAAHPGQAVDLVGHSMGGVVALWYLLTLHDPADPGLPPIGHVVTIASPLEGADIARGLIDAAEDPRARAILEVIGAAVGEDALSQAVNDLAVGSEVITDLGASWETAHADVFAGPLATGTRVLTIGAELDGIVPEHRSDLPGADHVVLPGTHDGVRTSEAVRQVVHAFLADEPVPGEAGGLGHTLSYPLGWVERHAPGWLLPG